MPERIAARVERAIGEKVFPGCVIGTIRANGSREIWPFGRFTYEQKSPQVTEDTIYDVASVTKSIPTASLALMLMQEGKMRNTDRVVEYVPELQNHHDATIEDLLTYRVHGTPLSALKDKTSDEILAHVFSHGFDVPPSGDSKYTNLPALLLGLIVERIGGAALDTLAQKHFFDPLGMTSTLFPLNYIGFTKPYIIDRIAPTEIDARGEVRGLPHDESAYAFAKASRAVGHAGLFSAVPDLLNFFERLLQGNDGFTKPVIAGAQKGLGWQVRDARFMGKHLCSHTFGKTGFTGTSVVCDIERGIAFVILSNRTYPKRPPDDSAIFQFRADIARYWASTCSRERRESPLR